jgi:small subunit ribosomal protein S6
MRERRRDYELMFIISPLRASEEDINTSIGRVHQAITASGGEVSSTDQGAPWGRRKFAYPIREYAEGEASRRAFTEGFYVLCHFNLPATRIPDLERSLKLNDSVLRYLLTLVDAHGQLPPAGASAALGAAAAANGGAEDDDVDDQDADEGEEEAGEEEEGEEEADEE